ncbi:NADH dehydrogenase [ubiquinone] 1 alpha subcomplex subunit 7-like [Metopolophium dirhodum]|uniref:NADH dehydrogenase [ubiquinone] 1 alpha subcomplex subunit 7-like n=1 Tax=Metopolophium dirhodum TaxID=44670 RepID=UPI00298F55B7|nr:NADH dehydrogenase [ubiquinone] 1 alpha subcomplex subunit 7-like [Metopolophium dirhodum]
MANWNSLIPSQFKPSGFISALRTFLGGRNFKPNIRMVDEVSSATQPPPDVPGGPNHTVFNNYYCTRDSRREVTQPIIIFENSSKLIENTKKPDPGCPSKVPLPGKVFHWD